MANNLMDLASNGDYSSPDLTNTSNNRYAPDTLTNHLLIKMLGGLFNNQGGQPNFGAPFLTSMIGKYLASAQGKGSPDYRTMLQRQKYTSTQKKQTTQQQMATEVNNAFDTIKDNKELQQALNKIGAKYQNSTLAGWKYPGAKEKKIKVNTATKKALAALGAYKGQKEALDAIERNREQMELSGADIDYITSQVKKILPEKYDKATGGEKFLNKLTLGKKGQKYDRRQKNGVWYEKQKDGLWHKVK